MSAERLVGKGGAGRVYRARRTKDGKELAVKVLKPSDNVITEFISEIEVLSAVDHRNATSLVGLCLDKLMLVYDYVRRGSLEDMLHGENRGAAPRPSGGRSGSGSPPASQARSSTSTPATVAVIAGR